MSTTAVRTRTGSAIVLIVSGLLLALAAWSLPVNLKSVSPALLHAAGAGTPSVGAFGKDLVDSEKLGPAALVLKVAQALNDPQARSLQASLEQAAARQPGLMAWGGWDPFLDPLFHLRQAQASAASVPVLTFLIPEAARSTLRSYLANSGSQGVQAILRTRDLTLTGRFVPATRPGGQPLDALILLTGILYQGEHLSPSLQRQVRSLAETATERHDLGELEGFYIDLLALGRRLDWTQLSELLKRTDNTKTVGEYAHLARVASDQFSVIYTAALFTDSADRVANYVIQYGTPGVADLRVALQNGQGAAKQLLLRQVPVNRIAAPGLSMMGEWVLPHPQLMLALKYIGYLIGAFLVLRGIDRALVLPEDPTLPAAATPHVKSGMLAFLFAAMLIIATEPFLLKAAPASDFQLRLRLPVLVANPDAVANPPPKTKVHMDLSTLVSIGFFALLQIAMYFTCLQKIREVGRQDLPPLVKLKLMENEENLFDGGLYVGIGGTATALVLQVLGVIEPNLLAAYSSNLFGITCVALVKIRHVRPFKRELIVESQAESSMMAMR